MFLFILILTLREMLSKFNAFGFVLFVGDLLLEIGFYFGSNGNTTRVEMGILHIYWFAKTAKLQGSPREQKIVGFVGGSIDKVYQLYKTVDFVFHWGR